MCGLFDRPDATEDPYMGFIANELVSTSEDEADVETMAGTMKLSSDPYIGRRLNWNCHRSIWHIRVVCVCAWRSWGVATMHGVPRGGLAMQLVSVLSAAGIV